MIRFEHRNHLQGEEIWRHTQRLFGEGWSVYLIEGQGVLLDSARLSAFMPTHPPSDCAQIALPLSGDLLYRRGGRERLHEPDHLAYDPQLIFNERWGGRARFSLLMIEWRVAVGERARPYEDGALPSGRRPHIETLARAALSPTIAKRERATMVSRLFACLRAEGIPVPRLSIRALHRQHDDSIQALATAFGALLSSLDTQPMWVDFSQQLGLSERQLRRRFDALQRLRGAQPGGASMRKRLTAHRLWTGCLFLSMSEQRLGDLAAALGYNSTRAWGLACRNAGLPSPAELRSFYRDDP